MELTFTPDRLRSAPLYRQLTEALAGHIQSGRLQLGERLPSTRDLAESLGVGRNTVIEAYEQLQESGLCASHVGRGTYVVSRGTGNEPMKSAESDRKPFVWQALLARDSTDRGPQEGDHADVDRLGYRVQPLYGARVRIDFSGGQVDPSLLHQAALRRAYREAIDDDLESFAKPLPPQGWQPLREQIARRVLARGIDATPAEVFVTAGAQQGLSLVAQSLLNEGDTVLMEQPGYFGAALSFQATGATIVGVPVDDDGLQVGDLAEAIKRHRPKLIYTTPSAQAPTGAVLSEKRRRALLDLADHYQVPIVEDDYDSELRFEEPPLAAIKTHDSTGQVIYLGTFSKAMFPGLRVGYLVAAPALLARIAQLRFATDFSSDALSQSAVCRLLESGQLERGMRRSRKVHRRRRDAMRSAVSEHRKHLGEPPRTPAGHAVWLTLPQEVDADLLELAAADQGISYTPGRVYSADGRTNQSVALAFAHLGRAAIKSHVAAFAAVVSECRKQGEAE